MRGQIKQIEQAAKALDEMIDAFLESDPKPDAEHNFFSQLHPIFEDLKWLNI